MEKSKIGKRIREARLAKNYTQEQLAELVDVSSVYMSELERGTKSPSLQLFIDLAKTLEVSTDYLLRDDLETAKTYIYNDITTKLEALTPKQRVACAELIDTYIRNL